MKKSKIKNVKVMIGSGEHSMFITIPKGKKVMLMRAGMTFSEARHHLEEKEYERQTFWETKEKEFSVLLQNVQYQLNEEKSLIKRDF